MPSAEVQRKLTAILSADVAGYSRLMGDDEESTVETLTAYRKVFVSQIESHRGRVVDAKGDAILAEFASVVNAVNCAVEVQRALAERNAELPKDRRMEFRIGVNLGDVVVKGEEIYGDGVNIAARLESLAEAGGICISRTVYDQVETKLPVTYEYIGEQSVKNIAQPVRAYRVLTDSGPTAAEPAAAATGKTPHPLQMGEASPLPDKPSIAVMAFRNMSGDPEQEYFSDGISEDIITRLARLSDMFVIAHDSSFFYKGKAVKVQQVGRELGVRYVLEGSVRKAGNRLRITAQLVDAATGNHLWADSYDREPKDVFAVQDEITRKVVTELEVKLTAGEDLRYRIQLTDNAEAYDYYIRNVKEWLLFTKESNIRARELALKAIELDPNYAAAIAGLGWTYMNDARFAWSKDPARSFQQAEETVRRALAVGESWGAHFLLSRIYNHQRLYEQAIAEGERALELAPGSAVAMAAFALTLYLAGRPEESAGWFKKAMRHAPYPPAWYHHHAGVAYYLTRRYEAAIAEFTKHLERQQHDAWSGLSRQYLIASYVAVGREAEARAEAGKLREQQPDVSIASLIDDIKGVPFKDLSFLDRHSELLRKAGLLE